MAEPEDAHLAEVVPLGEELVLAVGDAASGLQQRGLADVLLGVAAVDADGVQLQVLPGQVLVDRVLARVDLVQVEQQRRVLVRGDEHVRVAAQRVLADDVAVERVAVVLPAVEVGGDVQEVVPEVDHHLEQLPVRPDLPGDGGVHRLPGRVDALLVELLALVAQLGRAELERLQLGQLQLRLRRGDLPRFELLAQPVVDAEPLDVGEHLRGGAERGAGGQVPDRVLGEHGLHRHLGRLGGGGRAAVEPAAGGRVALERLARPGAHVALVLLGVRPYGAGLLAARPRRVAVGGDGAGGVTGRCVTGEQSPYLRREREGGATGDHRGPAEGGQRAAATPVRRLVVVVVQRGQSRAGRRAVPTGGLGVAALRGEAALRGITGGGGEAVRSDPLRARRGGGVSAGVRRGVRVAVPVRMGVLVSVPAAVVPGSTRWHVQVGHVPIPFSSSAGTPATRGVGWRRGGDGCRRSCLRESSQAVPAAQGTPDALVSALKTVLRPGAEDLAGRRGRGDLRSRADPGGHGPNARFRSPARPPGAFTASPKLKVRISLR